MNEDGMTLEEAIAITIICGMDYESNRSEVVKSAAYKIVSQAAHEAIKNHQLTKEEQAEIDQRNKQEPID